MAVRYGTGKYMMMLRMLGVFGDANPTSSMDRGKPVHDCD